MAESKSKYDDLFFQEVDLNYMSEWSKPDNFFREYDASPEGIELLTKRYKTINVILDNFLVIKKEIINKYSRTKNIVHPRSRYVVKKQLLKDIRITNKALKILYNLLYILN